MRKQKINPTEAELLRQKAEELLAKQLSKISSMQSESDILKLNHELSVHQIELEIQNKELTDAKENLEIAVEQYTDLYDFAPTGYLTLSGEGRIIRLNLSASKMIGSEPKRIIQNKLGTFITDDTKHNLNHWLKEIFTSEVKQSCEVTLIKGNELMYVYMIGVISRDGEYCDVSMIDITERKVALEKLNKVNKELEQSLRYNADKDLFISVLAHDLRNPFSKLLGYTELLLGDIHVQDRDYINKLITDIYNSTHITYSLLEDLLKWSRVRTGRFPFVLQEISFKSVCQDVIYTLSPIASTKKILINCFDDERIKIIADVEMIKAILRNLVSNAIKFTNNNGVIKISAIEINSNVVISVSDNGIGIEPERLTRLFDLSQYSSTKGTANEKGTGLGLLLCKEFAEKHGGKIWAESDPGKGSVFNFNIPRKPESALENIDSTSENEVQINNLKILIVDDDEALRIILGAMVENYAREILYAANGTEAVMICKNTPDIDLILMDYYMPNMNGREAIKLIRLFNREVIIVMETANELTEVLEGESRDGINDFFFKPYNKAYLKNLIVKYFHEPSNR